MSNHIWQLIVDFWSLFALIAFIVGMIVVYIKGTRTNNKLLTELEKSIKSSLDDHTVEIRKVQIKQDQYEFRCKTTDKDIRILTFHLSLANRSFIIQWLINRFTTAKERVFMGVKIGGGQFGDDDPVYKFDVVPYHRKGFIKRRYETFVEYDDIPTGSKIIDKKFMVKSEIAAYVEHFVMNPEFLRLLNELEPYLEHLGIQKAKEDTDPHISVTYEFPGTEVNPIEDFTKLFFLVVKQHQANHDDVRKLVDKQAKARTMSKRRGRAKRGGARRKTKKN